jgi:anti-sigma factor RsiW
MHPTPQEWMGYLYGETPKAARAALRDHLQACAECRASFAQWEAGKRRLNEWRLEQPRATSSSATVPALKWALAALVVLGLGFGIGRVSASRSYTPEQMREALEPSLKASLLTELRQQVQQEIRQDWQAAITGGPAANETPFRRELRAGVERWTARAIQASAADTDRLLQDWAERYQIEQREKDQVIAALFATLEQKYRTEHVGLRRALETVAVVADDKFQRTETQLGQLASLAQAQFISDDADASVKPLNLNHTNP